jgi:hypothetical protein
VNRIAFDGGAGVEPASPQRAARTTIVLPFPAAWSENRGRTSVRTGPAKLDLIEPAIVVADLVLIPTRPPRSISSRPAPASSRARPTASRTHTPPAPKSVR